MKTLINHITQLITNGSGVSIKSAFLFWVLVTGILILLILGAVMLIDVIVDGKVESSMADIASVITAVAGLFVAAGLPKLVGEIFEGKNKKNESNTDTTTE